MMTPSNSHWRNTDHSIAGAVTSAWIPTAATTSAAAADRTTPRVIRALWGQARDRASVSAQSRGVERQGVSRHTGRSR